MSFYQKRPNESFIDWESRLSLTTFEDGLAWQTSERDIALAVSGLLATFQRLNAVDPATLTREQRKQHHQKIADLTRQIIQVLPTADGVVERSEVLGLIGKR